MHATAGTSVVLALALLRAMVAGTPSAAALEPAAREPIAIRGNDGFRPKNGVVGGSGTAEDPYVIEGWAIDATWSTGISIQDTDAAFVVRDDRVDLTAFCFYASGSEDPDGDLEGLEVRWDWESDGVWDTTWSRERTAGHRFATEGTYAVRLEVRDLARSTDITSRDVRVWAVAVGLSIDWASLAAVATVGLVAVTVAIVATRRVRRRAQDLSLGRHASWDAVLHERR